MLSFTPLPARVAVLVHPRVSAPLALLGRELFQRAADVGSDEAKLTVSLVGNREVVGDQWALRPEPWDGFWDLVVVPPFGPGFDGSLDDLAPEVDWIRQQARSGARVASACLGAFLLGAAGLLDGREATTHWLWSTAARERFPLVQWQPDRMLCDTGPVVTAGGYLALVDLVLHLIETLVGRTVTRSLAQRVLADTGRQRQSVYAQTLTLGTGDTAFSGFDRWVEERLSRPLTVEDLAGRVAMSSRNFFRRFRDVYGVTPVRYLQRKRIEKAQQLLRESEASLEFILEQVGVTDPQAFRQIFRRELGLTPAEYRRRFRPQNES